MAHDSFACPAPFLHQLGRPSVFHQGNKMNVRLYDLTGMVGRGFRASVRSTQMSTSFRRSGEPPQGYSIRAIHVEASARNCRGPAECLSQ
jgi:hypothetical protein